MGAKQEQINSRLKNLKKELDRNEELMRKAAISYEDLIAVKESLLSTMEDLKRTQKEMRQRELKSA